MKTELRLRAHNILPNETVIELWWQDRLIGTVTGADGPGVRILSKYPLEAAHEPNLRATPVNVVEVLIR